ncbi:hypothetical protein LEP1GSC070_1671 [Leptospira santarosai str. AIM]|nr:hypothetical protein LEP1GSC070_1671 [Leptospira santarosai str. AIM]
MKKIFRVSFSAYFSSWVRPVYLFRLMTNPWDITFPHLDGMFRIGESFGGIVQTILSIRSFQFVFLYRVYSVFMKK